ncbi:MAG: FAD-dependent oxidoreductase, partial [Lentisphaerae bacterium]|nr:FAD-dependent oxidoreductase [Lentisphaerota bacterium]
MPTVIEPTRQTLVAKQYDVIVCGSGPAGIAAAISAARTGARTLLLEVNGCLGGTWTAGLLCWIIDSKGKPGVMREITARLQSGSALRRRIENGANFAFDPEFMKRLLEDMCTEAGVHIRLHTRVVAASRADQRLRAVITESKSGREAWEAHTFVDCTGDGDLGCHAGCAFDVGHPETGKCQPMSMACLVTGIHFAQVERFTGGSLGEPKQRLLKEIRAAGVDPSYQPPVLMCVYDELFVMIPNHEYDAAATDADDVTRATISARKEINAIVNALRKKGAPWENLRLVATAEHIGVREGRRIHGLHTVSLDEMVAGRRHEDGICRVRFGIDVHSTSRSRSKGFDKKNRVGTKAYDIPYRSLVA